MYCSENSRYKVIPNLSVSVWQIHRVPAINCTFSYVLYSNAFTVCTVYFNYSNTLHYDYRVYRDLLQFSERTVIISLNSIN
jgi:hypothetical protein